MKLWRERERHKNFELLKANPVSLLELTERYNSLKDDDYRELIRLLDGERLSKIAKYKKKHKDAMDYFTIWVHQIKTPIASMRLKLEKEDSSEARALKDDLFRIEQYVDMVLTYMRLEAESTDYVFREISVDEVIKGCLRKFAPVFIGKGLSVKFEPTEKKLVTDEKWFAFVLEQILSNAVKYTNEGSVSICFAEPFLKISDTGIGIAAGDLPRVFERGYTGYNGRTDKKATGLGLYLCKRICGNLGIGIAASSEEGKGTCISLDISQKKADVE